MLIRMGVQHEQISSEGISLHIARAGAGPAVVLLHGFPENWRCWHHQLRPLSRAGFSVWAPDLRGYDRSDRPLGREAYLLHHLVEDVAAVVRATGHSSAHIVGHDWGGIVAWAFAGLHPELTGKLVILNAPHLRMYLREVWRPPQFFMSWYVLFFQIPRLPELILAARDFKVVRAMFRKTPGARGAVTEEQIESYIAALSQPGALTAALSYYRANMRSKELRLASALTVAAETLVIWGEKDPALSIQLLDGLEKVAPKVRVHRIADAGHWVQSEAAAEVTEQLLEFLGAPCDSNEGDRGN